MFEVIFVENTSCFGQRWDQGKSPWGEDCEQELKGHEGLSAWTSLWEKSILDLCMMKKGVKDSEVGLCQVTSSNSKENNVSGAEEKKRNLEK